MKPFKVSVRKVVEFVLRCGDIDSRYVDGSAMQDGARVHRKIQKTMGEAYQSEVALSLETEAGGIPILLQGRADGVLTGPDGTVTVDEIKATTLSLERLYEQQSTLHLGQAKCYAYMLLASMEEPPDAVTLQLTYYQLETEEIERHTFVVTKEELSAFFHDLMERYSEWIRFERGWKEIRTESAKAVCFPFPAYRKGQRELAKAVYQTVLEKKKLYAQAPTGIGKTLSTIFPSVKAVGEGKTEKIFYLTAKTVTRAVAEDSIRLLAGNGLRFKSVTLRAKNKICFCEEPVCNPDACRYARGHYDRVNDALLELLQNNDLVTPAVVEKYAHKHTVCPYELALDVSLWADMVVCDYNHVFDPVVYLRRFFNNDAGDYVFLIDEAHNLVDRVRDMYTTEVRASAFRQLRKQLKEEKTAPSVQLRKAAGSVIKYLSDVKKALGEKQQSTEKEPDALLGVLLKVFAQAAEEWLAAEKYHLSPLQNEVLELFFQVRGFLDIAELYDERYVTLTEAFGHELVRTLLCLDPSEIIRQKLKLAQASVLFSATLTPLPYYREILGGEEGDYLMALPSPYEQERLLLLAHGGISTKYTDRERSCQPIADLLYAATAQKKGNYMVYFPSYAYLQQVYARFTETYPAVRTLLQEGTMEEAERTLFLEQFDRENPETLLGFCVLGGIFSEGIDLKGERLVGTVIVGVGLPRLSMRQDLIRTYFNQKNGMGYEYAYVYPGMNKVLQAAGRVIRSESDYGMVLLVDSRFHTEAYQRLYPAHWKGMRRIKTTEEAVCLLAKFPYFQNSQPD